MFVVDRFILLLTGGLDCCQLVYLMTMIANPVVMISPREKRERIQFMGTLKLFVKETLSYIFKIYFDCRLPSSVFFGSLWQFAILVGFYDVGARSYEFGVHCREVISSIILI